MISTGSLQSVHCPFYYRVREVFVASSHVRRSTNVDKPRFFPLRLPAASTKVRTLLIPMSATGRGYLSNVRAASQLVDVNAGTT